MAANNSVNLIGRLGADAELKAEKFVTFNIAVTAKGRNADGGEKTNWFKMVFRGERAEKCLPYLTKGKLVAFGCEAEMNRWTDRDGNTHNDVQFAVTDVEFIPGQGKKASADEGTDGSPREFMRQEAGWGDTSHTDLPF